MDLLDVTSYAEDELALILPRSHPFASLKSIQKEEGNLELAGLYWHFVDIVWIVIFTVVYLISANDGAPLL